MANETPDSCQVSNLDLFFLILGYVRYAMGRMSSAPSSAQDFIARYGGHLTDRQLTQIADEIEKAIQLEERVKSTLGATVDHETWKACLASARRIVASR
jgi:hypothetical protein